MTLANFRQFFFMKRCREPVSPVQVGCRNKGAPSPPSIPDYEAKGLDFAETTSLQMWSLNFLQEHAENIDAELCAWENEHPDSAMCGEDTRLMAIDRATSISRNVVDELMEWLSELDGVYETQIHGKDRMQEHLRRERVRKAMEDQLVQASMIATYNRVMVAMATTIDHQRMTSFITQKIRTRGLCQCAC